MNSSSRRKLSFVVFLLLFLSGCSTFSFFFDRLAWLSSWQLNRVFDLNQAQKQLVKNGAENITQWMRLQGFPQLVGELKNARQTWEQGQYLLTIRQLDQLMGDTSRKFLEALSPEILPVLLTLDEQNAESFRDFNQRHLREWYEYTDANEAKLEFRIRQFSRWFGDLNSAQEQQLAQYIALFPREQAIRIENNRVWTERMLSAALARDEPALCAWMMDPRSWWTQDFRDLSEFNRAQLLAAVTRFIKTMTPRQRKYFAKRLDKWIATLNGVLPKIEQSE